MKKLKSKKQKKKLAAKCTAAVVTALALAVQPYAAFPALADYYDDYYYGSYRYGTERKVTGTTISYDDGTSDKTEYKYDSQGNMVYRSKSEANGSKSTTNYVYRDGKLAGESSYEYSAYYEREVTITVEYGEGGFPAHKVEKTTYNDGTSLSSEEWNLDWHVPIRIIVVNTNGITTQTDYVYNEQGQKATTRSVSSDGSYSQSDWQYNDSGATTFYKRDSYDAKNQTREVSEVQSSNQRNDGMDYSVYTTLYEDGTQEKLEDWSRTEDNRTVKMVSTGRDGAQIIEEYQYDRDGVETLYTKTGSNGVLERRTTTTTPSGTTTTYSDSSGNSRRSNYSYDTRSGIITDEDSYTYSDGSSYYSKKVYNDSYDMISSIRRTVASDGTEIYTEHIYEADGSRVISEKTEDGILTVTRMDSNGQVISEEETLADGTRVTLSNTMGANGEISNKVRRYSDGSEDHIAYEYDASANLIKETEVRSNGVVAITDYQYRDADGNLGKLTISFNNGYQLTGDYAEPEEYSYQTVITYNTGEVFQEMITYRLWEDFYGKRIYSDGRVEEIHVDIDAEDYSEQDVAWMKDVEDYCSAYLDTAWVTQPVQ